MFLMARELFEVKCPCCLSTLKIDAEIRAVISHAEPEKKPVIEDLAAEVAKLKGAPGRREEAFQKSFAAEKNQGQLLNRKFDELLKQAKENPDFGKKPRDIDL
jgi:predicted nucleotide-binding protein (sugar kinase/HSP70/actin superfamily)